MTLYILPSEPSRAMVSILDRELGAPDFKALCTRLHGCVRAPYWIEHLDHDVAMSVIGLYLDNIYRYVRSSDSYSFMSDLVSGSFAHRLCVPFQYVQPIADKAKQFVHADDVYEVETKVSSLMHEYLLLVYLRLRDDLASAFTNLFAVMQAQVPRNCGDLYRFELTPNGSPVMVMYAPLSTPYANESTAPSYGYAGASVPTPSTASFNQPSYA